MSHELTEVLRAKVEECATRAGRTIPEQVARYVGDSSFRDYSRLMDGITWSAGVAQIIEVKSEAPGFLSVAS